MDIGRFTGASVIAELVIRFVGEESDSESGIFDAVADSLDRIAAAPEELTVEATIAGAWFLVATLGLTPAVDVCASCHADLPIEAGVGFSHAAGGAVCDRCSRLAARSRTLPPEARVNLRAWISGERAPQLSDSEGRAHQRLLREFVQEHLGDERPLRAFGIWEHARWEST